jgi:hypothetical protein
MLKDNLTYGLQKSWMCRLLFLVFLAIFAQSPVADAYSDSLCSSPVDYNEQNDPSDPVVTSELNLNNNRQCINDLKASKQASKDYQASLQRHLIQYEPTCPIKQVSLSAADLKSSQIYPPVSSDSSPPVV